jgi:TolB-like protein/predicted Ser/Thr protein kinase
MIGVRRVCTKCGADVLEDAPQGSCSACLLETGLGLLSDDAAAPQSATPLLAEFGDYELLQEIGRGGQGVVYRARQKSLNRTVALKVIGLGHWATTAHLKRFRQEAEAAASLDHPRVVPIYEVGEQDGACYFSMKFVEGGQLDKVLAGQPMPGRKAAELIAKLARTVQYAHEHGILHRDIKPGNVLLDRDGEPNLTDFGLARLIETDSTITRTMEVLGTPSYIAPEQAAGGNAPLTAATDVYGLGTVLYQLLTGQPPFAGGTTFETVRLVLESSPRKPRLWNPKVDRELETICLKCLEKDPQRRYSSALALAEDLERWLTHLPIRARRSGIITRNRKWVRRNPAIAVLAALLLLAAAALATLLWQSEAVAPLASGIAVLPFENLSDEKQDAFLADGLHDDILTKLAKVADLKVISRTSVMGYRGERNIRKIGNALRVSHVLEGSVHRVDGRIRVNAQLIDARSDTHVWAETYERAASEVFALESKLAEQVASRLTRNISRSEKSAIEARPTEDLEAYNLYLSGKELLHGMSVVTAQDAIPKTEKAVGLLETAVARDPNFALGWSTLAEADLSRYWTVDKPPEWRARAETALNRAMQLAPNAGETHLARALFFYWGNRDYDHALEELEVAARLLPNNARVFQLTSWVERRLGRWKECLRHGARAAELDPRDAPQRENVIRDLRFLRRYREAIGLADQAVADFPDNDNLRLVRVKVLLDAGDLPRARAAGGAFLFSSPLTYDKFSTWLYILLFERNWDEAERYVVERARTVENELIVPPECFEAPVARARNDNATAAAKFTSCRDQVQSWLRERPGIWDWLSMIAVADAALGREQEALREEERALSLPDSLERSEIILDLPAIYCWLGKREQALEELEKLVKTEAGVSYGDLKFDPCWDSLRDDPRFDKILQQAAKPLPL